MSITQIGGMLLVAELKINRIKFQLDGLAEFNVLPSAQLKDIQHTLDRMLMKAKYKHEVQLRRENLDG